MATWKIIPGTEGKYEASDAGEIRHVERRAVLQGAQGTGRYRVVSLSLLGRTVTRPVHRLVCLTFHGPPPADRPPVGRDWYVRHLDDNRDNNRADNLAWGTHEDNVADALRNDRYARGQRQPTAKLTDAQVAEIRRLWATGEYTQICLGEMFGVRNTQISHIVRGLQRPDGFVPAAASERYAFPHGRGGNRKLAPGAAEEIRSLYATGEHSMAQLAERFGITVTHVSRLTVGLGRPSADSRKGKPMPNQHRVLDPEKAAEIRAAYAAGATQAELAHRYGVSQLQINRVVRGLSWYPAPR